MLPSGDGELAARLVRMWIPELTLEGRAPWRCPGDGATRIPASDEPARSTAGVWRGERREEPGVSRSHGMLHCPQRAC